ncbi:type I polyketide synthase [Vibrio europaeus]|uniref:Polyketide synthase n=2 Tax=Vibrio europaeus TaxID=300876 RepID=A0A178J5S5_9VIBR|nr:type I polyketide synthase [Vibrio europaeus]MDC5706701.1 type I polyketide synthase [Vibrio europaeus]MDC5711765.1 type I polyketide synthase [Vibrio europaeus]MDC5716542.1 type I polyketide synthase [Vibrio europaeus]MDC5725841.1 type I polyketide synthase [Vibrio europaeus]MDC5732830.1 type I polyketide synthase [Vibrio europaeus]
MISNTNNVTDVAIVGISCAFPGAQDKDHYWQLLVDHQVATDRPIGTVKAGRVAAEGILENPYHFDAAYFNISPRDAKLMDPQHRKLLEHSVQALADANVVEHQANNKIGTFLSVGTNQYYNHCLASSPYQQDNHLQYSLALGNSHHCVATQVAYQLNLQGPAYTISTACSSSLVAVHQACQSLMTGESDLALAGGASINTPHGQGYEYMEGSVLSKHGRCLPFSADSDGTIPASGVGVVALKRLSDALRDKDPIYAVIKGGAINNDGTRKVGYTAPSIDGQVDVIERALSSSGLTPDQIAFIECHGTATNLGDPIEVEALANHYQSSSTDAQYALGSVKWNIGHTDTAAGIAGLIKVALSLKHNLMLGSPYLVDYNPELYMDEKPFFVPTSNMPYPDKQQSAAVSSFGMGGTNCHLILSACAATHQRQSTVQTDHYMVPLSSRHECTLANQEQQLADWLEGHPNAALADIAGTQRHCRLKEPHRRYHIANSVSQLVQSLRAPSREIVEAISHPESVLLIEGQGATIQGAALSDYEHCADFRNRFDQCIALFEHEAGMPNDLKRVALEAGYDPDLQSQMTLYAQPILFAIQYARAHTLKQHGLSFQSYIGHSLGEWIAAAIAGLWSLEDAVRLIACRARHIQACDDGAMIALFTHEARARQYLSGTLTIAALNGEHMTIIAGETQAIQQLAQTLQHDAIRCKILKTNKAFHHPMLTPAVAPLREVLASLTYHRVKGHLYSNLTGKKVAFRHVANPDYWIEQLLHPVQMRSTLTSLNTSRCLLTDIGVSASMTNMFVAHKAELSAALIKVPHPLDDQALTELTGQFWSLGGSVDWPSLPSMAWQKCHLPGPSFKQVEFYQPPTLGAPMPNRKRPVDEWFYQDSWLCQRRPERSAPPMSPVAYDQDWYRRDGQLIYRGFRRGESVTPSQLARFLEQLERLAVDGYKTCYILLQVTHPTMNHELSECYQRALSSIATVIEQEAQHIKVRIIGYQQGDDRILSADLPALTQNASCVYVDNQYLWRKTLVPVQASSEPHVWPSSGYVLITGGLGKIGLSWARYLLEHTDLQVVLTGRKPVEQRLTLLSELPQQMTNNIENSLALMALLDSHRVHYASVDVADNQVLMDSVGEFNSQLGALHGVIHCAAYTALEGLKPVFSSPATVINRHYQAKVDGTLALAALCEKHEPDFCILMSSISTQLGGFNLGVYAYTNQFMNDFVSTQEHQPTRWMSVSWDGWDLQDDPALSPDIKAYAINHQDCDEAFSWVFDHLSLTHCVASTHDIYPRLSQWVSNMTSGSEANKGLTKAVIERKVTEIFCHLLGVDHIEPDRNFFDMGGESVAFSTLVAEIRSQLDMSLPLHAFMNKPTLSHTIDLLATASTANRERETVVSTLTSLFEELLDTSELTGSSHFFDCGGDSLVFTQLAKRVKQTLDFNVSLSEFIDAPTIEHLADLICGQTAETEREHYDDLRLSPELWPTARHADTNERVFLVTGATGLLGVNLVAQLLNHHDVHQVVALVRAKDDNSALQRMLEQLMRFAPGTDTAKLRVVCGDVAEPKLGLTPACYEQLSQDITDVLHNAAHVNHILDYTTLKASNTLSMLAVLELAAVHRHKHIHFVSTLACVSELNGHNHYVESLPTRATPPAKHLNGYARSKWATEVLLEQAMDRGFSVNVVRPSSIVGHSSHGTFNADTDHIWLYVKGCLQLTCYPDIDSEINITPVDFMSELIVTICLANQNKVYNLPNPYVAQMHDLFDHLTARGYQLDGLPLSQWREQATLRVDHANALYPILSYYLNDTSDDTVIAPDYGNVVVDNTRTLLEVKGLIFPQPHHFISNLVDYLEHEDFFGVHHAQL